MLGTYEIVKKWRLIPSIPVKLSTIKRAHELQPRKPELARFRDRSRLESASTAHIEHLADQLYGESGQKAELEPVLLARIGGKLWLVDGHHRYLAYRRANRQQIPARIFDTDMVTAVTASKVVNCDGVKLQMHPDQLKEAAWQFLAHSSQQGKAPLPEGTSLRAIGRIFGVSSSTMSRMHAQMRSIKPEEFNEAALDPGTNFPLWKYVKGNAIRDRLQDIPEDKKLEQLACKISALIEKHTLDGLLKAVKMLEQEALIEAVEDLTKAVGDDDATDY